jgi:DUF177 domain-containing protein
MLLDLSRFRSGEDHLERRYAPADFGGGEEGFRIVGPVEFVADLRKDSQKVRLTGRVRTTLECDCSRCLEPFAVPVDAGFDLILLPAAANSGEGEREVEGDDLGVSFYDKDVIDLGDVMREQFYLALPMKPLCGEECRGLCPVCGVNRNRETCSCQTTWVDPRMEQLRKLRDRDA